MAQNKNPGGEWQRRQESGGVAQQERPQESGGVLGSVAGMAQNAASNVASAAEQAWETTSQAASSAAQTAEDTFLTVRGFLARYPFATFFAGVGVGALLFFAFQRRQ